MVDIIKVFKSNSKNECIRKHTMHLSTQALSDNAKRKSIFNCIVIHALNTGKKTQGFSTLKKNYK